MTVQMNHATDYVHTHVVNYEQTYNDLMMAVDMYRGADAPDGGPIDLDDARDLMAESVENNWDEMGLRPEDWDREDVDYAVMIQFEAGE